MGIKKNFVFSTVLTVSNYIFPFIIYPYVARVLGVNNMGICNFVDSIVNYAIMISSMGILITGVREVAKANGNRTRLDIAFTSQMVLCSAFTIVATIALVTATYTVKQFVPYRPLLFIGVVKLWSNFLLINWLYRGLEDFKYITIRTIAVKIGYLISVFVFVHKASDYGIYYLLLCLMVTVNAAFNCTRAIRLVSLKFDWAAIRQMARPFVVLGIYLILNSMYTSFNVLYLGMSHGDTQVGYYTSATKIFQIILGVFTAYSGVVMPRVSALLNEGKIEDFRKLISKSIKALMLIAVPAALFTTIFSRGIVLLVAGPQYGGAVIPMMIVMPLIFIIGYEQILVIQILTPMGSDKMILLNSIIGAIVGITANILIVGKYAAIGSAVVWLISEVAVLISAQYFVTKYVGIRFPWQSLSKNLLVFTPYIILAAALEIFTPINPILRMMIGGAFCVIYFIIAQKYILRNEIFMSMYHKATLKIRSFSKY